MDELTIIVVTEMGIRKFDLKTEDGNVNIVRGYYQYDQNGSLQNRSTVSYPADFWQYTEEGYLIFEGSCFSDENYILTVSDTPEHTMLRLWMKSAGNITESISCQLAMGKTTCFSVIGARTILGIWTFTIYLTGSIQCRTASQCLTWRMKI